MKKTSINDRITKLSDDVDQKFDPLKEIVNTLITEYMNGMINDSLVDIKSELSIHDIDNYNK